MVRIFLAVVAAGFVIAAAGVVMLGLHPGLVATELVAIRVKEKGLDPSVAVPMTVPARMLVARRVVGGAP